MFNTFKKNNYKLLQICNNLNINTQIDIDSINTDIQNEY